HKSDNTSTDVLIERLGGVLAVAAFLEEVGISGICFKRNFAQVISSYYGLRLPVDRRPHLGEILAAIRRLQNPYIAREVREESMIASGDDCCTPRAMADLLTMLATEPRYALALSHMRHCAR